MAANLAPPDACSKAMDHRRRPSMDFKHQTKREAQIQLSHELERLLHTCPPHLREEVQQDFEGFEKLFARFIADSGQAVEWERIQRLEDGTIRNYQELSAVGGEAAARGLLDRLVVVKLNGGLGTSMGCQGPKSTIPVRSDLTFLDLTVQQIKHLNQQYGSDVPLVLMNSFNTDEDTQKVIRKYQGVQVRLHTFKQSRYPRINRESLMPLPRTCGAEEEDSWYPPGHGDFYSTFYTSGLLDEFIKQGKEYVFISNIDNLGATVDLAILNFLLEGEKSGQCPFLMEVTDKTRADVKGGTLIRYKDELRLLEIAQVAKENVDEFKSVKKFKIFNTNNLWIKLDAIREVVTEGTLDMEVIVNNKTVKSGVGVTQLEQAVGAAIKNFRGAMGLNVPRSRFLPVKKTDDLLLVMSNLYRLQRGTLSMSPLRQFDTTPLVKLGNSHFGKVKDFLKRFGTIPDMLELDHLSVSGDVTFGRGVVLKGTVIIIANHGDRIDIPAGSILENKIVSGNMRILDH